MTRSLAFRTYVAYECAACGWCMTVRVRLSVPSCASLGIDRCVVCHAPLGAAFLMPIDEACDAQTE